MYIENEEQKSICGCVRLSFMHFVFAMLCYVLCHRNIHFECGHFTSFRIRTTIILCVCVSSIRMSIYALFDSLWLWIIVWYLLLYEYIYFRAYTMHVITCYLNVLNVGPLFMLYSLYNRRNLAWTLRQQYIFFLQCL